MARKPIQYKVIAERVPEDPEISAMVTRMEAEADEDIASRTVTLRWGPTQIGTVKHAAALFGIPYQTYLKQVVFRQALKDIAEAQSVLGRDSSETGIRYPTTPSTPQRRVAEE